MNKGMITLSGGAVAMMLAAAANAGLSYSGAGGTIPDSGAGVFTSDIVVSDTGSLQDITVTLKSLNHTWIGDLIVTIEHVESGSSQTLFSRVGKTNATTGVGDSSNLGGDYSFNDAFTGDLWAVAASGDTSFVIPSGDYFATGALSGAQVSLLSVFGGIDIAGTWRLTISDNAAADTGDIGSWNLFLTVPAPGALALLGLAGLAPRRRRNA
ncbi:MAG: hypothetical protein KDA22_05350 [Phycisphaerales bacterium]|nr:hypothetical protein [Phycisphaerales bacterium]